MGWGQRMSGGGRPPHKQGCGRECPRGKGCFLRTGRDTDPGSGASGRLATPARRGPECPGASPQSGPAWLAGGKPFCLPPRLLDGERGPGLPLPRPRAEQGSLQGQGQNERPERGRRSHSRLTGPGCATPVKGGAARQHRAVSGSSSKSKPCWAHEKGPAPCRQRRAFPPEDPPPAPWPRGAPLGSRPPKTFLGSRAGSRQPQPSPPLARHVVPRSSAQLLGAPQPRAACCHLSVVGINYLRGSWERHIPLPAAPTGDVDIRHAGPPDPHGCEPQKRRPRGGVGWGLCSGREGETLTRQKPQAADAARNVSVASFVPPPRAGARLGLRKSPPAGKAAAQANSRLAGEWRCGRRPSRMEKHCPGEPIQEGAPRAPAPPLLQGLFRSLFCLPLTAAELQAAPQGGPWAQPRPSRKQRAKRKSGDEREKQELGRPPVRSPPTLPLLRTAPAAVPPLTAGWPGLHRSRLPWGLRRFDTTPSPDTPSQAGLPGQDSSS